LLRDSPSSQLGCWNETEFSNSVPFFVHLQYLQGLDAPGTHTIWPPAVTKLVVHNTTSYLKWSSQSILLELNENFTSVKNPQRYTPPDVRPRDMAADRDRKFQQQVDRTVKKIEKGDEFFQEMWLKIESADPMVSSPPI
jgi:hypothetical protein